MLPTGTAFPTPVLGLIEWNNGLKVVIDLHAAPGSQNGWEHSSSRDGSQEWGQTDANIRQTVDVIDFLAARSPQEGDPTSKFVVEGAAQAAAPAILVEPYLRTVAYRRSSVPDLTVFGSLAR
ncbi:hypothetical protein SADUNF_Sadunf13G0028900 [Salix dunnii]|uniref:Uncharacterized protein n=1 Tax=Salix dunnii TaxID=1413687 RepID=A0A835MKM7_9ROSI|nr:hypothetical protein SADUNF_Sadunf13G0028900 [Salix dunnii]